ncbi:MAG: TetR/AcrR family transcriptional regulator, partial [Nitrosomonas sp.]|nr:TetR/AcrR family transcriptional regulator [Nitrosomonas sp.]
MLTTMVKKISVKEKILQTARRLFCQVGFHATGITRILDESGVSRRSLYTHYGSKENLLKAVFQEEANIWFRWFDCD